MNGWSGGRGSNPRRPAWEIERKLKIRFYGGYTGNDLADLLLGLPQEAFANQAGGKGFSMNLLNGEYSFYFQDNIKILPSLTLNAGFRYEYVQWPLEKNDELATWNFEKGFLDFAGKDISRRIAPPDRNNWGPRLGLAYTVAKKTVIRAGSGVTYGNFRQWEISLFHFNPPFLYDNFQFNDFPSRATPLRTCGPRCRARWGALISGL
jgi:hypothetical protein